MKGPMPVMQVKVRPGCITAGVVHIGPRGQSADRLRGEVQSFTASSRSRLLSWLSCAKPSYRIMITLTLPHVETDGALFKAKLDRFLDYAMRKAPEGASMTWFLEFQKRGAPHAHILTNFRIDKEWVSSTWATMWSDRMESILGRSEGLLARHAMEKASTRCEYLRSAGVMKRYACKYSAKTDQKEVPEKYSHVGRFWGIRGSRERVAAATWRKACVAGFWGFPGDVIRMFWIRFNRFLLDKERYRVFRWSKGTGVSVYFSEGSTESVTEALKRLLEDFEFEVVVCQESAT